MSSVPIDEQVEAIMFGSEFGEAKIQATMRQELKQRLEESRKTKVPLRVYAGYDPSKPDLHLGHSITLRKLRQFQDLGHKVTFLVGTFTAQVGDTSDKAKGRPRLSEAEVFAAADTYAKQAFTILDPSKTEIAYNHEWLSKLTLADVVSLASNFTVQQFLVRDNYRKRLASNSPVGLHEFLYALLQGYDAVHLHTDVQIGASEQLFNILAGRKLQESFGQRPCVCITYPILVGTDGQRRMSKSTGNYIGLTEPPDQQFGKVMSISDTTMVEWIKLVTRWPISKIGESLEKLKNQELHPRDLKKALAWEVVSMSHGDTAANQAERDFEAVHQEGAEPENVPLLKINEAMPILELLTKMKNVNSRSAARRLLNENAVKLDKRTISEPDYVVDKNCLLQVGKHRFARVEIVPGAESH